MSERTLDDYRAELDACARESGAPYVAARDRLVAAPADVEIALAEAPASEPWRRQAAARAISLWRGDAALCRRVSELMAGGGPLEGSVTGAPSAWRRGELIAALGPEAAARVVELLALEQGFRDTGELGALLTAATLLRAPWASQAALEVASSTTSAAVRAACVEALGRMRSAEAIGALLAYLEDTSSVDVQRACARALGMIGRPEAAERLAAIAADRASPSPLRADAAAAAAKLVPEPGIALVARVVEDPSEDLALRSRLVQVLAATGSELALPPLDRVAGSDDDAALRAEAEEAAAEIRAGLEKEEDWVDDPADAGLDDAGLGGDWPD